MLMFKVLLVVSAMAVVYSAPAAPVTAVKQQQQYLNALNEAVASYLSNSAAATQNVAATQTANQLQTTSATSLDGAASTILQAQASNTYPLMNIPDYIQQAPGYHQTGAANVNAAVQTKRTVEVKPIMLQSDPVEPHIVDVEASYQPVQVVFRSSSSPVMVQQIHTPAQPIQVEPTQSEDEPHRVQHQVMRPVIQEIREIIQPYRRVLQEIRPVLEEVRTIVAKAEGQALGGSGGASGAGGAGGAGGEGAAYGPGIMLASDGPGSGAYGRGPMRSAGSMRKAYSRRSGSTLKRHIPTYYMDRSRS